MTQRKKRHGPDVVGRWSSYRAPRVVDVSPKVAKVILEVEALLRTLPRDEAVALLAELKREHEGKK